MARPSSLPAPAPQLVFEQLHKAAIPMTAYELLEALRSSGIKSAPIIYRALQVLIQESKVHKLKELRAFVVRDTHQKSHQTLSLFTVCSLCKDVDELHDETVIHQLENLKKSGMRLQDNAIIELPIICDMCAG